MEMVTREWSPWCLENGARQILRLKDCECGGFTQRTRWFAIWGPRDLEVPTLPQEKWKGWGQALLCFDRGARLSTEANSKAKRWKYFKAWQEPAHAVVGGDRRVVIRMSDGEEWRLPPSEAAALQGFPLLQLPNGLTDREAQTMVGNGWPRSFGLALGRAIKEVS
jgi:site-specific DNA-cytosine methylase